MATGTLRKEERASGAVWVYRWQTTRAADGKRVENTRVVGKLKDIGSSEAAAWRKVSSLSLDLLADDAAESRELTFKDLATHYQQNELKKTSGVGVRAVETVTVHELNLRRWILPRWGEIPVTQIRPLAIEQWFESLATNIVATDANDGNKGPLRWPTIGKLKSIMSLVFKHAQRHDLIPAAVDSNGRPTNPVLLARTKSESDYEAVIVSPEQMIVMLAELDSDDTLLQWTAALLIAVTGLRAEEAFALQWQDVDWGKFLINIERGWSKGKITAGKTKLSMTQVAMHPALAEALQHWRHETAYGRDEDWVFPSKKKKGKIPRTPGVAAQDYLRPAAIKAGVITEDYTGRFGWHNLRHSLATFFGTKEGISLATIQAMLRHSKPATTALYLHRVNKSHLEAQGQFLAAIKISPKLEKVG